VTIAELVRTLKAQAPGSLIPRDWLLDLVLGMDQGVGEQADTLVDLGIDEAGLILRRSSSTVREYCRRKLLPGCYRQRGREWRIPRAAIVAFQRNEAGSAPERRDRRTRRELGLSDWRKEFKQDDAGLRRGDT